MSDPYKIAVRKVLLALLEASRKSDFIEYSYLREKTRLTGQVLLDILKDLGKREQIVLEAGGIIIASRIGLVEEALRHGIPVDRASLYLDWRDFEALTAKYLQAHGYRVYRNLRLPPPHGLEIDVLGLGKRYTIVVDCKHWSPGYSKKWKLRRAVEDHLERIEKLKNRLWVLARKYGEELGNIKKIIPVIVTLTDPGVRRIDRVLVSPISTFNSLLLDLDVIVEELKTII